MTYEEAISYLECGAVPSCCCSSNKRRGGDCKGEEKVNEAINIAIEALEKQIQKKPDFIFTINIKALDEPIKTDMWKCPNCGLTYNTKEHHCFCGQAIDWSDEL